MSHQKLGDEKGQLDIFTQRENFLDSCIGGFSLEEFHYGSTTLLHGKLKCMQQRDISESSNRSETNGTEADGKPIVISPEWTGSTEEEEGDFVQTGTSVNGAAGSYNMTWDL
ncbi:hypothetical protein INR49_015337 [Caranx melampygus]|nr:hypothetical protein INR49_015337 [Caranx melampygus]